MAGSLLPVIEEPPGTRKQIDCVEIYLPKSIEFLSELYRLLHEMVSNRFSPLALNGFSIYEVDGVFRGETLWEQRTLVIRLMFIRSAGQSPQLLRARISLLGREIANVAGKEEEIWICDYPQNLTVFTGLKKLFT
jgi:hypothetical protein